MTPPPPTTTTTPPALPQFLTRPLRCNPTLCHYSHRPLLSHDNSELVLHHLPVLFERATLPYSLWATAETLLATPSIRAAIENRVLACARLFSDHPFRRSDAEGLLDELGIDAVMVAGTLPELCRTALSSFWRYMLRDGGAGNVRGGCLHDSVGATNAQELRILHDTILTHPESWNPPLADISSLMNEFNTNAALEQAIGYRTSTWEDEDIEARFDQITNEMRDAIFARVEKELDRTGFGNVMRRPGVAMAVLTHLQEANQESTDSVEDFISDSAQITQFVSLCLSPISSRTLAFSQHPSLAPFELIRPETYFAADGSPATPTPNSIGPSNQQVCWCELTHHCDDLERLLQNQETLHRKFFDNISRKEVPTATIFLDVERLIRTGKLAGECWEGDWKPDLEKLLQWINTPLLDHFNSNPTIFAPATLRIASTISSAQIFEEVMSATPNTVTPRGGIIQYLHFQALADFWGYDHVTSEDRKLHAEKILKLPTRVEVFSNEVLALSSYGLATLLDPTNVEARLNGAAIRLRVADDLTNVLQWSHVISDCTAALYYGNPSYKAYYRRGYALDHLRMWDKAILDYKQALLLVPHDPVVTKLLAAAARRPRSSRR